MTQPNVLPHIAKSVTNSAIWHKFQSNVGVEYFAINVSKKTLPTLSQNQVCLFALFREILCQVSEVVEYF